MFASIFTVVIVKPIFNLLVFIYAILPGHNFGLSLILFTVLIRLLMWPLVKKQLHQSRAMRELQPEIKRVKQEAKGNRQLESQMLMELYKEREINPVGSIGTLAIQFVILIGLYSGLRSVISSPKAIITNSYSWIHGFSWMQALSHNIHLFDATLLGVVNLTKSALSPKGGVYWPAMIIVVGSAVIQYLTSKQLLPTDKNARGLKQILKEAGSGKKADQTEINAAVGKSTQFFIPFLVFLVTVNIASALSLYWLVGGLAAYIQQAYILRKDEQEMEVVADKATKGDRTVVESEVTRKSTTKTKKTSPKKRAGNKSKRRKK